MNKTNEQLITENEELRSRLVEAEEALIAIQSGEVDAIVVSGRKGEQVYSLSSAETPYRTFIEEMDEGALTLTKTGLVIYCNRRLAELVGEHIERVIGSYFRRFVAPADRAEFDKFLAAQNQDSDNFLVVSLINSLYLKLSIHLMPSYLLGDNCILVATDISEMKREEKKLLELSDLLEQKFELIQQLRLQLIEKKIEAEAEIKRLNRTNNKLIRDLAKHKLAATELKQKLKHKRGTG